MKKSFRQCLSIFLVLCLISGMSCAFAEGGSEPPEPEAASDGAGTGPAAGGAEGGGAPPAPLSDTLYTVRVYFDFDKTLKNVSLSLGSSSQTLESAAYGGYADFTDVPRGNYVATISGTGEDGVPYNGSAPLMPFIFDFASDGVVPLSIASLNADKPVDPNIVTLEVSLVNKLDGYYITNPEALISFTSPDGTSRNAAYTSTGSYVVELPKNTAETISVTVSDPHTVNGNNTDKIYHFQRTLSLGAENFSKDRKITINLTEANLVSTDDPDAPITQEIKVAVRDSDYSGIEGAQVSVQVPDADSVTGTTGSDGTVSLNVPILESYLISAVSGERSIEKSFEASADRFYALRFPGADDVTVTSRVFIGDKLVSTKSAPHDIKGSAYMAHYNNSRVSSALESGLLSFTKFSAARNGEAVELSPDESLHVAITDEMVTSGDELTLDWYFDYQDGEKEYTLSITHIFMGKHNSPVHIETGESLSLHAGEGFSVSALTTAEKPYIVRDDIKGYTRGGWSLGLIELVGGAPDGVSGEFDRTNLGNPVEGNMVHEDASLCFTYWYTETELSYDANASSYSGSTASQFTSPMSELKVNSCGFSRDGFKFTGWNTEADGSGKTYAPGSSFKMGKTDTVLYAQWEKLPPSANPKTGDPSDIALTALICGLSLISAAAAAVIIHRKKEN